MTGVERSPEALAVARGNAAQLGLKVDFLAGSWFEALAAEVEFDLIVANPPYVADGLACIRTIVAGAASRLAAGAWLLFEHGYDQAAACRAFLAAAGFIEVASFRDLAGIERVSGGVVLERTNRCASGL